MKECLADIPTLLFHLKSCPDDFLKSSVIHGGIINTHALLKDTYRKIFGDITVGDENIPFLKLDDRITSNHLLSIHIGCWLFSHSSFLNDKTILRGVEVFLFADLFKVEPYVNSLDWIRDEDRAEEFIRLALKSCSLLPKGEKEEEASDRFDALSTLKRRVVLQESNAAMQRIKELRQKMAEAKAREAANVYGRE
jgi:hypothetical protein